MNIQLAREIYSSAWYMDAMSFRSFSAILADMRNGVTYSGKRNSNVSTVDNDGVHTLELKGAITRSGGDSHYGTKELAQMLRDADNADNVLGHVLSIDSGGGSVNAVPIMTDAIKSLKKPIVSHIDGMSASAAKYISSFTQHIIAERATDKVGSIGTMIEMSGYPKISEDKQDGLRYVRIYADASTDKNGDFEEAINNLNFKPIIDNVLNPHNERFIADMKANRPTLKPEHLTGKVFDAGDVIGYFVDEIGSIEVAKNKVKELSKIKTQQLKMTKEEVKANHSSVYDEIHAEGVNAGVTAERKRISAWQKLSEIDAEMATAGIEKGEEVTADVIGLFSDKAIANVRLKAEGAGNNGAITIDTGADDVDAEKMAYINKARVSAGLKPIETK